MTDKERIEELYAVKDKNTGKFVTTLTNPNKKYWDRKPARDKAIQSPSHNWRAGFKGNKEDLIPVDFVLVEKQDYFQNQNAKVVEALKKVNSILADAIIEVTEPLDKLDFNDLEKIARVFESKLDYLIKEYGGETKQTYLASGFANDYKSVLNKMYGGKNDTVL